VAANDNAPLTESHTASAKSVRQLTRIIASPMYDVSPTDPVASSGAYPLLFTVALLAANLPAHRTTRIEPAGALRAG
jgi:hypothetical protein